MIDTLPTEVLDDFVLPFLSVLDLCRFEYLSKRMVVPESPWQVLFLKASWSNISTQTVQRGFARGDLRGGKDQLRDGYIRERAACVVELGSHVHRIGSCFHSHPRLVPKTALDLSLTELCAPTPDEAAAAISRLLAFLVSSGLTTSQHSSTLSILLVVPFNTSRHALTVLARRCLAHPLVHGIRFEHAATSALVANYSDNPVRLGGGGTKKKGASSRGGLERSSSAAAAATAAAAAAAAAAATASQEQRQQQLVKSPNVS